MLSFFTTELFGFERANAHTRRETRVAIESNHHESYPSPLRTVPNAPRPKRRHFLPRFSSVESRATTKTFFLASIFGLQRRKTRARRSFVSPLPRAVGSHPASPFFVSPAVNLENDRAPPRRVSVVGVSTCAPTTRTRLAARFFLFFFFTSGYSPRGFRRRRPSPPGAAPPRTNTGP